MSLENYEKMRWPGEPKVKYGGLQVREIEAEERCAWVKNTYDCNVGSFVPYPTLLFCTFGSENKTYFGAGLALLVFWLLYLFLILGTTADNFFCPSLSIIASVLRLSENIAGVTILAFGNGSPDIFTSLVTSEDERLIMFTELIGAGVFVTAIIAGSVVLCSPFRVQPKYFIRDACFYIVAVSWVSYIIENDVMHLWECFVCLAIYAVFIVVVVVMQRLETASDRRNKRMPALQDADVLRVFVENRRASVWSLPAQLPPPRRSRAFDVHAKLDVAINREVEHERSIASNEEAVAGTSNLNQESHLRSSSQQQQQQQTSRSSSQRPKGLFREFLYDVNPVSSDDWNSSKFLVKVLLIVRAPFMLVLQLCVPVVNETAEKRGWSKLLNCLQLGVTPVIALCVLELWDVHFGPVPLLAVCFGCTSIIALVVFALTSVDRIPRFHNSLAFVGFLTAMVVVYACAQEVMAVLETIGFASGISDAMLGITLLAWGNSVGDLISNVTIARKGYPRMGFSACFGGPMFNTLLGVGLTFGISAARSPDFKVRIRTSDMAPGCLAFLLGSLVSSLIYLCVTGFIARRSYGYLLFTIYAVFILINVLSEIHFIHPLGTDHRPDEVL